MIRYEGALRITKTPCALRVFVFGLMENSAFDKNLPRRISPAERTINEDCNACKASEHIFRNNVFNQQIIKVIHKYQSTKTENQERVNCES